MLPVAIIGATGYTGLELLRLLLAHSQVQVVAVTSEKLAGEDFCKHFPAFQGRIALKLESLQPESIAKRAKLVFLALPHHEAMKAAATFLQLGCIVIDLSADFRLRDAATYEQWYGNHSEKECLAQAVYGLPELYRDKIKKADLIANPGCYPTSCILGLAPLLREKWIDLKSIHCDSKSGVSGAGRSASVDLLFGEVNEDFKAYKVTGHRHTPEIEQELSALAGQSVTVSFTPHLVPMNRGILSTLYAQTTKPCDAKKLHQLYSEFYKNEVFVRVRALGDFPSTNEVRMTNYCDLGVHWDARTGRAVIVSVIDNLTKGASGQAVQNMNIRMGFEETEALKLLAPST